MKKIKQIIPARNTPIGDLVTFNALPSYQLSDLDPFLFLNHHGPQVYPPNNNGLPFGPHPHRGMETVTFIIDGDIMHRDSNGYQSTIKKGGIQWMTAGSGLVHEEISSNEFKSNGGKLEILQMWLNLPASLKNTEPNYLGLQEDKIVKTKDGDIDIDVISGTWKGSKSSFETLTDVNISLAYLTKNNALTLEIPEINNTFFYVIRGSVNVNDQTASKYQLVNFELEGEQINIKSIEDDTILLIGHGKPFGERIVAQGPFVMNSEEEIREAYADFRAGKYGYL